MMSLLFKQENNVLATIKSNSQGNLICFHLDLQDALHFDFLIYLNIYPCNFIFASWLHVHSCLLLSTTDDLFLHFQIKYSNFTKNSENI